MKRLLLTATLTLAVTAPAASAWQQSVRSGLLGCGATVSVTDVAILFSNPPQVATSGNTGATTDCP